MVRRLVPSPLDTGGMFDISLEAAGEIVLRSLLVYAVVLALLRFGGRRELGQVTTTDIVVMILIANAVQNSMVGPDTSLVGGLISAFTLVATNVIVGRVRIRSPRVQRLLDGTSVTIATDGTWIPHALRSVGLTPTDALNQMGSDINDVDQLAWAVVDPAGRLRYKTRAGTLHETSQRIALG
jgi:uncharacterized membrane protein YcaP (DUF421 family)